MYFAIRPSVTISWPHHHSTQTWTWILLLCTLSVIFLFPPRSSLYPISPLWLQLCMLILDFKTMGGVLSQLFSLSPGSQQIIYLLQKCRALIWVRGPSPAARSDASHWSSFAQFLPCNCWFLLGCTLRNFELCLLSTWFYWDWFCILFNNKSYGPAGICLTKLYASSLVYLLASSRASNDRDQTGLKTFLGFIVAYNEHKV